MRHWRNFHNPNLVQLRIDLDKKIVEVINIDEKNLERKNYDQMLKKSSQTINNPIQPSLILSLRLSCQARTLRSSACLHAYEESTLKNNVLNFLLEKKMMIKFPMKSQADALQIKIIITTTTTKL